MSASIAVAAAFFIVLSTITEFMPVDLPVGGRVTIGFPVDFVVILVYGPAWALLVTFLGEIIADAITRRTVWYKILFNASSFAAVIFSEFFLILSNKEESEINGGLQSTWTDETFCSSRVSLNDFNPMLITFSSSLKSLFISFISYFRLET